MTAPRYDVIAIGNAIVDVMAPASDELVEELGMTKGGMTLVDADQAKELYDAMGPAKEISGGSAANTLAGLSGMGAQCAFVGQVADDQLGNVFAHDIRAVGIDFDVPAREGEPPTARCLIFVTPDGQRTMNTFLGATQFLPAGALNEEAIGGAEILYLEGYLWDPEEPRKAMRSAIATAKQAGRKVAFTLSDAFVIERYGDDFRALIDDGLIDILFVNEEEAGILEGSDPDAALESLAKDVPLVVMTRGGDGAVATRGDERASVKPEPVAQVKDLTGAGDLFAAGFLSGYCRDASLEECLVRGAVAAGEVISHWGARPEADLKAMVAKRLG